MHVTPGVPSMTTSLLAMAQTLTWLAQCDGNTVVAGKRAKLKEGRQRLGPLNTGGASVWTFLQRETFSECCVMLAATGATQQPAGRPNETECSFLCPCNGLEAKEGTTAWSHGLLANAIGCLSTECPAPPSPLPAACVVAAVSEGPAAAEPSRGHLRAPGPRVHLHRRHDGPQACIALHHSFTGSPMALVC